MKRDVTMSPDMAAPARIHAKDRDSNLAVQSQGFD